MKVEKKRRRRHEGAGYDIGKEDVVYRVPGTSYVKGSSPWEHAGRDAFNAEAKANRVCSCR